MEKKNKPVKVKKTTGEKKYLIEGTNQFIQTVKSPALLLEFVSESLWWMDLLNKEEKTFADSFNSILVIQNIIGPWFAGGPDVVEKIADGLKEIESRSGSQGFNNYISNLIQGLGISSKNGIYSDIDRYLATISAMIRLGLSIREYEDSLDKRNAA